MQIIESFGAPAVPPSPSQSVRRLDHGVLASLAGFAVGTATVAYALWRPLPGLPLPDGGLWHHLATYPSLLANTLSFGRVCPDAWFDDPAAGQVTSSAVHVRLLPACIAGALIAFRWGKRALHPQPVLKHLSGPRLLEGREAQVAAERYSVAERGGPKVAGFARLHPALRLSKRTWCRHVLISGSVGSGKTQILYPIVRSVVRRKKKLFVLDIKGDYTAALRRAMILSPFDARSVYWDIAADLRDLAAASTFASAMIPTEQGSNSFFATAADLLLTGCIRTLQQRAGVRWTWADLDFLLNLSVDELAPLLAEHYAKAHPLLTAGDSTAANILATLSAYTRTISQLAESFGAGVDAEGRPRKRLSLVAWAQDTYEGCPTIVAQAGTDPGLTQRFLAAVLDTLVPQIMALPDDVSEDGRAIVVALDEISAVGRLKNLVPLVDKGRSKSCAVILGVQDLAMLAASQGEAFARALPGMVGTHIYTQTQIGPTRDQWAKMLGECRVMWTTPGAGPSHPPVVHEEMRAVVAPTDLTTKLGYRKDKKAPNGFFIRAMACLGEDYWVLDWPGVVMPKKRRSHVPAAWMVAPSSVSASGRDPFSFVDRSDGKMLATNERGRPPHGEGDEESESGQPTVVTPQHLNPMTPFVADVTRHVQNGLTNMEIAA
jgi:hypothetical protein